MNDNKKLVFSIIQFLRNELGSLTAEACESMEVAIQCLENAYEIESNDVTLQTATPLTEIFSDYLSSCQVQPATAAEKTEAECLKNEGNNLMKIDKFHEALECYTKAIKLDGNNPVYYCNRAAAYSRLNNHQATIDDCKAALRIEPSYSKAYGRLGLAYTSLNMFQEAKNSYLKALELEPGNQTYTNNLELNEEQLRTQVTSAVNGGPRIPTAEGFDFNTLLANPSLMSMATQMLSDPALQNMMSSLMTGSGNDNSNGMEALLQAGQRLAQHMQSANPDLVDQLRQQMNNTGGANSPNQKRE